MKLSTFIPGGHARARVGVLHTVGSDDYLIDATAAYAGVLRHVDRDPYADPIAAARVPADMIAWLEGGEATARATRRGVDFVASLLRDGSATTNGAANGLEPGMLHRRDAARLLAPIPRPGKIIAVGANYAEHVREGRDSGALRELPAYPPAFLKMSSAVIGPDEDIVKPDFSDELDYEVELSIVIGQHCRDVRRERWLDVVAGYTIVNDLSLRDVILKEQAAGPVFVGKSFPTACPMGPFIVTKDELTSPDDLALGLRVNGEVRQADRTSRMIHDCAAVVAYWSRQGLEPGDVLTTGTPGGGAGFGRRFPERLLKVGDVVEAEIEGIGILRNRVAGAWPVEPNRKEHS